MNNSYKKKKKKLRALEKLISRAMALCTHFVTPADFSLIWRGLLFHFFCNKEIIVQTENKL